MSEDKSDVVYLPIDADFFVEVQCAYCDAKGRIRLRPDAKTLLIKASLIGHRRKCPCVTNRAEFKGTGLLESTKRAQFFQNGNDIENEK